MADSTIDGLPTLGSVDRSTDKLAIWDASDSLTAEMTINSMLGFSGGSPMSTTDTQIVQNKILDNTTALTIKDSLLTFQDNSDTTKQAQFQLSGITTGQTRTYTLPDASTTLVGTDTIQILTNKILTSPTINTATISNPTLTIDAISEHTSAAGVTIDGMLIKDGTVGPGTITPAGLVTGTGSTWAWQSWTPTWTNLTVGNGTQVAKYIQIGKTFFFELSLVWGGTTSISGTPNFSLPITLSSNYIVGSPNGGYIGSANYLDASTAAYVGALRILTTTTIQLQVETASTTSTTISDVSSTLPFTFASGDKIFAYGFGEVA